MIDVRDEKLIITGPLEKLESAIDFAIRHTDNLTAFTRKIEPNICAFQIGADGRYCIGRISPRYQDHIKHGWTPYPFDYDPEILSKILCQYIDKIAESEITKDPSKEDRQYDVGFILSIENNEDDAKNLGIKNHHNSIFYIYPAWVQEN